jgi:hypothetical protein
MIKGGGRGKGVENGDSVLISPTKYEVLSRHLLEGTEENQEIPQIG